MKKFIAILLFANLFFNILKAQVEAPDFLCVKGDTLFWEIPSNNCGAFIGYHIFWSENLNGPYDILNTVLNQATDFYIHPNPAAELRYYFLKSDFDCPGQTQFCSDTLDSRPPEVSPLKRVTVDGSDVLLSWHESPSPEVFAYIIYRKDPIGVIPIDTAFHGNNAYTDNNAEPDMESESYFVNALDRCGNTSIFDVQHNTVFLEGEATICNISLSWNLYENWTNGLASQDIWVGFNASTSIFYETIDGNATSYDFTDVSDGDTYCFVVQANENSTSEFSRSNEICITADIIQPNVELYITNVTIQPDNSVALTWGWDKEAAIQQRMILRSEQGGDFESISTEMTQPPLQTLNFYLDENTDPDLGPIFYQTQTTDDCGIDFLSATASPIFLSGSQLGLNVNQLNWTLLDLENVDVSTYELFRITNGTESNIGTVNGLTNTFDDTYDPSLLEGGPACYYVLATATVVSPSGEVFSIKSRSNTVCFDQLLNIVVPNALAPEGVNKEFKPLLLSGKIAVYEMAIYDRYGSKVFTTETPDEGWQGTKDGKKLPPGVYVYRIQLLLENGDQAEKSGPVLLLR